MPPGCALGGLARATLCCRIGLTAASLGQYQKGGAAHHHCSLYRHLFRYRDIGVSLILLYARDAHYSVVRSATVCAVRGEASGKLGLFIW